MKKILFCDNTLWGLVNFRGAIIRHFVDKGYDITLVAPEKENAQMQTALPKGVRYIPIAMGRTSMSPFNDIRYFRRLIDIYRGERPDYIFHYTIKPNIYGSMAARLLGIRSTAMMPGMGYTFKKNTIGCRIARILYHVGLKATDHLFLLNDEDHRRVRKLNLCPEKKIIMLRGGEGVDLERLPYHDNTSKTTTFIFIGRILADKGYYEFTRAARVVGARHSDARFEILGALDSQYPDSVPRRKFFSDEKEGVFTYLGFTDDMTAVYKRPGLVITLPSAYGEGMNRVLMEGCASGKPIITSNIAGCREMVAEGVNGYLMEPRNAQSLISAMERYLNLNEEERKSFSIASRHIAEEQFNINDVISIYENIISHYDP